MQELTIGATVRNRVTGDIGTVKYSTFGVKVAGVDTGGNHWKTSGFSAEILAKYWEVVDDE